MLQNRFFKSLLLLQIHRGSGTIMLVALLLITLLTTIGTLSITASGLESQAAGNSNRYQSAFYIAESGWKEGAMWLDSLRGPPKRKNSIGNLVRNYGGGETDELNNNFSVGTEENHHLCADSIPYWFRVEYLSNRVIPGSGRNYRKFYYYISSNADRSQEIDVTLSKMYKVGY